MKTKIIEKCKCGCGENVKPNRKFFSSGCALRWSNANNRKGKTYDEIYGFRAKKIIKKCTKKWNDFTNFKKGKKYEEVYGKDRALKINESIIRTRFSNYSREERSEICRNNGRYGLYTKKSITCGIKCDSSYESIFVEKIYSKLPIGYFLRRCSFQVKYVNSKGDLALYSPDFEILLNGSIIAVIEVKSWQRLKSFEKENSLLKFLSLKRFCESVLILPCLFMEEFFNYHVNTEPSSLNSFIQKMNNRFFEFVGEKVQRLKSEEEDTDKLLLAPVSSEKEDEDIVHTARKEQI